MFGVFFSMSVWSAGASCIPDAQAPDITGGPLLEEFADLLDLSLARGGVEEQVAQLGGVGLDIDGALGGSRVALEHQDLVLGATFLLDCMHLGCCCCRGRSVVVLGIGREWSGLEGRLALLWKGALSAGRSLVV